MRIASFALCGFANFGSLAIVLGGLGGMVPERRKDLARLGIRSILAGSLATFLTGTIAGLIGGVGLARPLATAIAALGRRARSAMQGSQGQFARRSRKL